ncbi:hypothetical protein D3C76_884390 [compost metagenome]
MAQVGGERHHLEALLCLDRGAHLTLAVGMDAHRHHAELGAERHVDHLARHRAAIVRAGDQVVARLRPFGAANVQGDLVEHVADLREVPARFGQRRHVYHHRLAGQVHTGVGVDGHVVGRDNEAILGGLELGVLAQAVQADRADLHGLGAGNVVVVQRIAPEIGLDAKGVGVLLAGLFRRQGGCRLRGGCRRLCECG